VAGSTFSALPTSLASKSPRSSQTLPAALPNDNDKPSQIRLGGLLERIYLKTEELRALRTQKRLRKIIRDTYTVDIIL